jgi:hypothetical protein
MLPNRSFKTAALKKLMYEFALISVEKTGIVTTMFKDALTA